MVHNQEIDAGAATMLYHTLRESVRASYDSKQVFNATKSLNMVFRCSDEKAIAFFHTIGIDILQILLLLVEMNFRLGNEKLVNECQALIGRWAGLKMDLTAISHHEKLLPFLVESIRGVSCTSVVHCAIILLQSLSRFIPNKIIIAQSDSVLECVFDITESRLPDQIRGDAARTISNLAWSSENKHVIASKLPCLISLSNLMIDKNQGVLSHTLDIMMHLSAAPPKTKTLLVYFKHGLLLRRLLQVAQDFTQDEKLCVNATHSTANLVCRDTSEFMAEHDDVVHILKYLACGGLGDGETATQSALCLKKLATYVTQESACHSGLLRSILTVVKASTSTQTTMWASRAIKEQACFAANSPHLVDSEAFLSSVARLLACHTVSIQLPVLEAIEILATSEKNSYLIASDPFILSSLLEITMRQKPLFEPFDPVARRLAVGSILALCTDQTSAKKIANHYGLVRSLRFCGKSRVYDIALRRAAIEAVVCLTPFL